MPTSVCTSTRVSVFVSGVIAEFRSRFRPMVRTPVMRGTLELMAGSLKARAPAGARLTRTPAGALTWSRSRGGLPARLVHDLLHLVLGLLDAFVEVAFAVEDLVAGVLPGRLELGIAQVVRDRERSLARPEADPVGGSLEDVGGLVRGRIGPNREAGRNLALGDERV